jgi:signal transduction histidine kinase
MLPASIRTAVRRPGLASGALLLATLALAGGLGYQATRAAAAHAEAIRAALTHYGAIAAWQYGRNARIWVGFGMNQAGRALAERLPPGRRGPLPGPELVATVLAEKECDCMSAGFSRTIFRLTPGQAPEIVSTGDSLSAATRAGLLAAVRSDSLPAEPNQWRILPRGTPALKHDSDFVLLWQVDPDRTSYGMIVEPEQIRRPLRGALSDVELFPQSLVGRRGPDSLASIRVEDQRGNAILRAGSRVGARPAIDTLGWRFGGLSVTASIDSTAGRLLVGGMPASRPTQVTGLLALTLIFGASSLLLLRREHHLARLRDDFVSGVSHELRTPLTQIRMMSELLESDGFKTPTERARATAAIHRESLKLTNLVDNILQFARSRRTSTEPRLQRVAIGRVVSEAAESLEPLVSAKGDRLELALADGIELPADPDAIGRIVRNLVENAVKYGPAGQRIRVSVELNELGGATLAVSDEGPGIPPKDRARVWQPYQRLERDRNTAVGGSGLGLSVVAELVAALGGRAWVDDAPGRGARFVVELPGSTRETGARA